MAITCTNRDLSVYRPATRPEIKGLPVPNTPENEEWWYNQAEKDLDAVITALELLEKTGLKWATDLAMWLIREV